MTLILFWRDGPIMAVIADTQLSQKGAPTIDAAPKIFSVPVRIAAFDHPDTRPQACLDMGFAFAGHTGAGQMTHALASAGCLNLVGKASANGPSVRSVAEYYSRCAVEVGNALRKGGPYDCSFEGAVFGWENGAAVACTFQIGLGLDGMVCSGIEPLDFEKYPVYGIGVGIERAEKFFHDSFGNGVKASPLDALEAMIADEQYPTIGGRIQGAFVGPGGAELKPVLWVDTDGRATGGYMGFDQSRLGFVGDFSPLSTGTFRIGPSQRE